MNSWNLMEKELKSWELRRPSLRIEARLFPAATGAGAEVPLPAAGRWLAPALALGLLMLMAVQSSSTQWSGWTGSQSSNLLATVALNQPLLARYYAPSLQHDRNTWPKATFEWTNHGHALTSAAPLVNATDSRH